MGNSTDSRLFSLNPNNGKLAPAKSADHVSSVSQEARNVKLEGSSHRPMNRIIFMGTPEFAIPTLAMLVERFRVVAVVTQRDKPAGRGQQLTASPVKRWAALHQPSLPILQPRTLRDAAVQATLAELKPDVIVVAAFGLLLPQPVLDLPPFGCVNVHASLLPRYRGAAPIPATILNGDTHTGITLMKLDAGMDTGPIITQTSLPIQPDDTTGTLSARLAELGAQLTAEMLPRWLAGEIAPQPQDEHQATLAPKLNKDDGRLDWSKPAVELERRVRALSSWPGTFTTWNGKILRILSGQVSGHKTQDAPGLVVKNQDGIGVVTGEDILQLGMVQLEGKRAMSAADLSHGHSAFIGSRLGA
jgi:methionyl-tRNA formyltransferase